jgi:hypothetical protein
MIRCVDRYIDCYNYINTKQDANTKDTNFLSKKLENVKAENND